MKKELFDNWIYETNADNSARFVLGEKGSNPLVCIGVNPSTATPEKLDPTLQRVKAWSQRLGYDGWIMLNLYPQRATNPNDLHEKCDDDYAVMNNEKITNCLWNFRKITLWAAWGTLIEKREYLAILLKHINNDFNIYIGNQKRNWITIGKRSNAGHPHHPLYLRNNAEVAEFDIKEYLEKTMKK